MSAASFFDTPIEYLKGVGPQRAEILKAELGIYTFNDLLHYFPNRHEDRSKVYSIAELNQVSAAVQVVGAITGLRELGKGRGQRLVATLQDRTGALELVWFKGASFIKKSLKPGAVYQVYGKPTLFNGTYNIAHPELELLTKAPAGARGGLLPVYPSTEKAKKRGVDSKLIRALSGQLLQQGTEHIPEILPNNLLHSYKLMSRKKAFEQIHFPASLEQLSLAENRLKVEEFLLTQLKLLKDKERRQARFRGYVFNQVGGFFNGFFHDNLPFELTNAQKRVVKEIRTDLLSGTQMNRLVQGDVGSGKTLVALMAMLLAADNGFQSVLVAPTEVLAKQHFNSISKMLKGLGLRCALLTGSTKQGERRPMFRYLEAGDIHILVGTHAVFEDKVRFKKLGLAVIDEQHKFGVAQRASLWNKGDVPPHILVMTATPIPRTLAMTLYGDLEVSVIDELPPGRKAIVTRHLYDKDRLKVFGFLKNSIDAGRQAYIVYPLIEESATLDYKNLMDGYESISRAFPAPDYRISIVHGQMKPEDKELEMSRFKEGKTQLMVSTTVIEVGVDVPNSTVMVIENAERFGLSQLHQLRGRVGRGGEQSYCILISGVKLSAEARKRLEVMVATNDGFVIAEEDLKIRGPGDISGTQQSGLPAFKIANLVTDQPQLATARSMAVEILEKDQSLANQEHARIRRFLEAYSQRKISWGMIS